MSLKIIDVPFLSLTHAFGRKTIVAIWPKIDLISVMNRNLNSDPLPEFCNTYKFL